MLKVLYDYQIACAQKFGGVSRYHYELMKSLNSFSDCKADIAVLFNANYYFANLLGKKTIDSYHGMWKPLAVLNRIHTVFCLVFKKYNIFHPTWYASYVPKFKNVKTVVTIHDMIQELLLENQEEIISKKKKWIYNSDHIIAISENTKKDILKLYPDIPTNKISVVYHGTNHLPPPQEPQNALNYGKYILFVGGRSSYKNASYMVEELCDALNKLDINIVFAGAGPLKPDEIETLVRLGIKDKVYQINASDEELAWLYKNAYCFIYPSMYEGFGFPILEAYDNQCPVICSNSSSLPEVAGNGAIYFNPSEKYSLRAAFAKFVEDEDLRMRMICNGEKIVEKFSWDRTARETFEVYNKLTAKKDG